MRGLRRRSSGGDEAGSPGYDADDESTIDRRDSDSADTGGTGRDGADSEEAGNGENGSVGEGVTPQPASAGNRWKRLLFPVVSAVLIVALVVVAGLLLWQRYSTDDSTAATADVGHNASGNLSSPYIDKADEVVLRIVNASPDTAEENAQAVLDNSIGDFHDVYAGARDQYLAMVTGSEATSEGKIIQSGLESIDGTTATVLVLASTEVTNKSVSEPSRRDFRLRVTVDKQADGYKVSNLEQVV